MAYTLEPIGVIRSELKDKRDAPLFYDEGAPGAWLDVFPAFAGGLRGMRPGHEIVVLTWLHQGLRDVLEVHPRGNAANPLTGVFATRSPDRPNPVGLHRAKVLEVGPGGLRLDAIEAIDGTPVVDIKPVVPSRDD